MEAGQLQDILTVVEVVEVVDMPAQQLVLLQALFIRFQ